MSDREENKSLVRARADRTWPDQRSCEACCFEHPPSACLERTQRKADLLHQIRVASEQLGHLLRYDAAVRRGNVVEVMASLQDQAQMQRLANERQLERAKEVTNMAGGTSGRYVTVTSIDSERGWHEV